MSSNQHRNLTGSALHNPKGFDSADGSTYLTKDSNGSIYFAKVLRLPNALNVVSGQSAPPTEVSGDVYLIDTTGTAYDIDTITWQSGNTIRYTFNGSPDLSAIAADDYFVTSGNTNSSNDGVFVISAVNDGSDYIEITNVNRDDNTDDEATDAIGTGYYTLAEWDGVQKNSHARFDGNDWVILSPNNGDTCFDETSAELLIFNGTSWNDFLASSGDVSQSGTSSDNQIAVFTADKTIEGNSDFTFDSTLNTFNINQFGTGSLNVSLGIAKMQMDSNPSTWQSYTHDSTTNTSLLELIRSRGTAASPSAVQSGDALGRANFKGYNTSSYIVGGLMEFNATETWSGSAQGTEFKVQTILTGATSLADRIVVDGSGDITLGNYKFDGDQTVGPTEDNYVLTYDNATGLISLEASAGGGGVWTDNGGGHIEYSATDTVVEITDGTANTFGTASLRSNGNLLVGNGNTFGGTTTNISGLAVIGDSNIVGASTGASIGNGLVFGGSNTIPQLVNGSIFGANNTITGGAGSLVFMMGNSHTTDSITTVLIGDNNETKANDTVVVGHDLIARTSEQMVFGTRIDLPTASYLAGTYLGHGNASNSQPLLGIVRPATQTGKNVGNIGIGFGASTLYITGKNNAGDGILYIGNLVNQATEPTVTVQDSVGLWAKDRSGGGTAGLKMQVEDGTNHFLGDFSVIGGDQTVANANKTLTIAGTGTGSGTSSLLCEDSGGIANFEVRDDGVIIMASLPTSSAGLPTGALWNNSGVLNIV